jgi:hypothetical protein
MSMSRTKKLLLGVAAGALGVAVLGGAALGAFAPSGPQAADEPPRPGNLITRVLDGLVGSGTITEAQKQAILTAFSDAKQRAAEQTGGRRPGAVLKAVHAGLMRSAVDYLGLSKEQVRTELRAGKSLGEIAAQTSGKDRAGLVAALTAAATAKIDAAQTAGNITAEQATRARTNLDQTITRFVDRKHPGGRPDGGGAKSPPAAPSSP